MSSPVKTVLAKALGRQQNILADQKGLASSPVRNTEGALSRLSSADLSDAVSKHRTHTAWNVVLCAVPVK